MRQDSFNFMFSPPRTPHPFPAILSLLSYTNSQFLPHSDDKTDESKEKAVRDRDGKVYFHGSLSEIPPLPIIYRLVSLRLGADSFIR